MSVIENIAGISDRLSFSRSRANYLTVDPSDSAHRPSGAERLRLVTLRELLLSDELDEVIDEGNLTYAMLRPHLEAVRVPGTDAQIAERLIDRIRGSHLGVVLNLPIWLDREAVEEFYAEVKPRLEQLRSNEEGSIWDSFSTLLISGATSTLLLGGESAVGAWRRALGPTIADPLQDGGTIRGDFATRANNIAHGSDSLKSVHREKDWLAKQIGRVLG